LEVSTPLLLRSWSYQPTSYSSHGL
jgi:hypothetical protein